MKLAPDPSCFADWRRSGSGGFNLRVTSAATERDAEPIWASWRRRITSTCCACSPSLDGRSAPVKMRSRKGCRWQ